MRLRTHHNEGEEVEVDKDGSIITVKRGDMLGHCKLKSRRNYHVVLHRPRTVLTQKCIFPRGQRLPAHPHRLRNGLHAVFSGTERDDGLLPYL